MTTLDHAKRRIAEYGTSFGAAAETLSAGGRLDLAAWFVAAAGVPNVKARNRVTGGNLCRCGGQLVRTGTCETCSHCGESSGGCG